MAARLQVSVIEARDVDNDARPVSLYVKIAVGRVQAKTNVVQTAGNPKFLSDLRLQLQNTSNEDIQIELLQQAASGDVVVGCAAIPLSHVVGQRQVQDWVDLRNAGGHVSAKLFVVLRYSTGLTPPSSPRAAAAAPLNGTHHKTTAAAAADTPAVAKPAAVKTTTVSQTTAASKTKPAAAEQVVVRKKARHGKQQWISKALMAATYASAAAIAAAAVAALARRRPQYYEVREGDTLSGIANEYGTSYQKLFEHNRNVIDDPDLIYPGDRIKIV